MDMDSKNAAATLLSDHEALSAMMVAAEDIHATGVSFNVVICDALRAVCNAYNQEVD